MSKVFICDFNDSFTHNIYSCLKEIDRSLSIEIIDYQNNESFFESLSTSTESAGVILGPGPGKPTEYKKVFSLLRKNIKKENLFFMGICLGHQLLWELQGYSTVRSSSPVHGEVEVYRLPPELKRFFSETAGEIRVQRYNSLCIKLDEEEKIELERTGWNLLVKNDELVLSTKNNIVSCQFHPESIGTEKNELLFKPLLKFLEERK